ncbi:MAG: SDR family oxidoreductase [Armatimonadetes bacterium]|nr:SDR family oxidoreductase [Armatimonadota bacterium]
MLLKGKKGLVLNVTNKNSIGWGIAEAAAEYGAEVGIGAQNADMTSRVQKLIDGNDAYKLFEIDFQDDAQMGVLVEQVKRTYGKIDFLVHAAAYAPREDLQGRFIDTSRAGFSLAMEVSCYSLITLCRAMEPLLNDDASVMTLSYLGSTRAVDGYNVMGVAKAGLESTVRYLAADLGDRGIRVNTLSPGPVNTISARGVKDLAGILERVHERAPLKRPYGQRECGLNAVYLMSDLSLGVTGQLIYIDSGFNVSGR